MNCLSRHSTACQDKYQSLCSLGFSTDTLAMPTGKATAAAVTENTQERAPKGEGSSKGNATAIAAHVQRNAAQ